jgi:hypothetical protein
MKTKFYMIYSEVWLTLTFTAIIGMVGVEETEWWREPHQELHKVYSS